MDASLDAKLLPALIEGADPAVSLYFPVSPNERNPVRPEVTMRNLLDRAAEALAAQGLDQAAQEELLAPVRQEASGQDFAHHRDHGFALFLAPGQAPLRVVLPGRMRDAVLVVGRRFHVKPLLPHLARNRSFHVLALTGGDSRLFAATPFEWREVPLDALPHEVEAEAIAREEAGTPSARDDAGADELRHTLVVEDLRRVAYAVRKAVGDNPAPVLLAGEPEAVGHFKPLAHLPQVQDDALLLNPFAFPQTELHAKALERMQPVLDAELEGVLDQVRARLGTGEPTVGIRPEEILSAARQGRIDSLVVAEDSDLWGRFTPTDNGAGSMVVHGHQVGCEEELLNEAAVEAMRTGAHAYAAPLAQMPRQSPAVAIYRF